MIRYDPGDVVERHEHPTGLRLSRLLMLLAVYDMWDNDEDHHVRQLERTGHEEGRVLLIKESTNISVGKLWQIRTSNGGLPSVARIPWFVADSPLWQECCGAAKSFLKSRSRKSMLPRPRKFSRYLPRLNPRIHPSKSSNPPINSRIHQLNPRIHPTQSSNPPNSTSSNDPPTFFFTRVPVTQ